jgi:hypothetical protein
MIAAHRKLERQVTGALASERKAPLVPRLGPEPPSWWISDEEASASTMLAIAQMGAPPT